MPCGFLVTPTLFLMSELCSPEGRGIPDISAQALNFLIIQVIDEILAVGTSCAPVRLSMLPLPPLCVVHPRTAS
jgi:hypothetical protein